MKTPRQAGCGHEFDCRSKARRIGRETAGRPHFQNQGAVVTQEIQIYIPAYSSKNIVATAYMSNRTKNNAFFWPTSLVNCRRAPVRADSRPSRQSPPDPCSVTGHGDPAGQMSKGKEHPSMEHWNPYGWMLLASGFLFGMVIGWFGLGGWFWMIGYCAMLTGLTILTTNLIRAIWRQIGKRKAILSRLSF